MNAHVSEGFLSSYNHELSYTDLVFSGIKAGRAVFKKAREDTRSKHHVFVAAALMEYYCSKDKQV